jgi:preprotein translocase subunit SecE
VARQTRQQRRARRREQAAAADGAVSQRAMPRQPALRAPAEAAKAETAKAETAPRRRGGVLVFIAECWGELKKVDWPNQRQVMTGTVAVIIACAIVGAYLYGADLVFRPFVERVLLGN